MFQVKTVGIQRPMKHKPKRMLCRQMFSTWSELTTHSKDEHEAEREYQCSVCGEKQMTANGHAKHMLSHEEERLKYTCDICKKKFALKCHMNVHSDAKPYSCAARGCKFTCKLKQGLNRHMVVHSGEIFTCPICSKNFSQKHYLTEHVNNTHGEVNPCRFIWNGCTFAHKHCNILNPHEKNCQFNPS